MRGFRTSSPRSHSFLPSWIGKGIRPGNRVLALVVKPDDYTPAVFTPEEEAALRKHRLAVYRDKIITEAQPPITDEQVAAVEAKLTKPIPQELLALWRTSFGGSLDYV